MEDSDQLVTVFALLEEMRPYFCCIDLSSDYNYVWDIMYIEAPSKWTEPEQGHQRRKACDHSHVSLVDAIKDFYSMWKAGTLP